MEGSISPDVVLDILIAESRTGKGIFATRMFREGEVLFTVTGPFVSCDVDDDMDEKVRANTIRYDSERYVSPVGNIGDFLNHSCEPNAMIEKRRGKLVVVAHHFISKGEEVRIDYSTITARDDEWTMRCHCGSATCRKVVRAFHTLPEVIRERYIQEGVVPRYILAI